MHVNDNYVTAPPSDQAALNLFEGVWASQVPIPGTVSGSAPLFADARIDWMVEQAGSIQGLDLLELGPLEAGHTKMMLDYNAASVLAIEANTLAYLRCLIVKELLGLKNAHFLLGDFVSYLAACERRIDLIVACGVLYHLTDPLATLADLSRLTDRIFIWSHFFDAEKMAPDDPRRVGLTGDSYVRTLDGFDMRYHSRSYGENLQTSFSGGIMSGSVWVERDEVIAYLEKCGFTVTIGFDEAHHQNGPAACLYAQRH